MPVDVSAHFPVGKLQHNTLCFCSTSLDRPLSTLNQRPSHIYQVAHRPSLIILSCVLALFDNSTLRRQVSMTSPICINPEIKYDNNSRFPSGHSCNAGYRLLRGGRQTVGGDCTKPVPSSTSPLIS